MPNTTRSLLPRYGVAAASIAVATIARLLLNPVLGDQFPFATLFLAVLVAAWYGGFGPALAATVLGVLASAWFFLPPQQSLAVGSGQDQGGLALYVAVSLGIAALGQAMRVAQQRAETTAQQVVLEGEKHRAEEEARRRSERELADFFENATVGLHWVGPEGKILRANQAATEMLGYAADEYVGRDISEFHADREAIRDLLQRLQAGENIREWPARMVCKDGSIKDVLVDSSVLWEEGRFVHTRCFTRDVTARKRAEEAVRERERQLQVVTDNAPVLIANCDAQQRYRFVNKPYADRLGLDPKEIVGKRIVEVLGPDVYRVIQPHVDAVLAGRPVEFEVEVAFEGAGMQHMQCAYQPELDANGRVVGYVAAILDVTEAKRFERALRDSEQRFRQLAENIREVFWMSDPNKQEVLYVSPAYEDVWGRTCQSLYQQPRSFFDAIHSDDKEAASAALYRQSQGEPSDVEYRVVRPDGTVRWIRDRGFPIKDESQTVYRMAGIAEDITDRYRAAEDLRASEQRFRTLASHAPVGIFLTDPEGNCLFVNERWCQMTGISAEAARGQGWIDALDPEDRQRISEEWYTAARTGQRFESEYRFRTPHGKVTWVQGAAGRLPDEAGGTIGYIGTVMDISQQRNDRLASRFLVDASAALATIVDLESTLQNVARLAVPCFADWCTVDMLQPDGAMRRIAVSHVDPAKAAMGQELSDRYPPDPKATIGVWSVVRSGRSELVAELSDDALLPIVKDAEHLRALRELDLKSYVRVPLSAHGKVLGVITFLSAESGRRYDAQDLVVAEDLAHRAAVAIENAQLYQALREADRRKDEFLALLGHELRNPLAPIRNSLQVLKVPQASPATVERARELIERQVEHMVRLVDDLLDVSRIMRGRIDLRREPVELATVVARAVETVQPIVDAEGHELVLDLPSEPLWLHGDLVRLAQVLGNLLNNAAKYTAWGGRISVRGERQGASAVVRVRDTGTGIAPDVLPHIFDMFYQADSRSRGSEGGLGIGLSLVRGLVEMHGGAVEARSEGKGKGSEFIVRLPLQQAPVEAQRKRPDASGKRQSARKILVTDDNVDAAESLAMLLRLQGHQVLVAHDGQSALDQSEADPPDLALLDIGMPNMDGYELARRFRQHSALRSVLLIALTGWGQEEDRRRSKEAGFDHHLVKPVEVGALARLLSRPIVSA